MKTKHTPGPWAISEQNSLMVTSDKLSEVAFCGSDKLNIKEHSERQANARLIAAAPELLTACKSAVQFVEAAILENVDVKGFNWQEHLTAKELLSAIAKANA